jgi:hypothetical protein
MVWPKDSLICLEAYDYLISAYNRLKLEFDEEHDKYKGVSDIYDFIRNFNIGAINKEYDLLSSNLWKEASERRNSKVDFLSRLQFSNVFIDNIEFDSTRSPMMKIDISILDIEREEMWFRSQLLKVDNFIAMLHKECIKQHIAIKVRVLTYDEHRAKVVKTFIQRTVENLTKAKAYLYTNSCDSNGKFNVEIYQVFRNNNISTIYHVDESIKVINMNIKKYLMPKCKVNDEYVYKIVEKDLN